MNKSVCTICADYLTCENSVACPCGHTFHHQCISRWKEQSSTCPQCRKSFKSTIKLYFELSRDDRIEGDPAELKNEVTELNIKIRVRDSSIEQLQKENDKLTQQQKAKVDETKRMQRLLENALGSSDALQKQVTYLEKFKKESQRYKDELQKLHDQMASYRNIQELIGGESYDIERTIQSFGDNPDAFNQICTSHVLLKKEFDHVKESKRKLENEKKMLRRKVDNQVRELFQSNEKLETVTNDLKNLDERNRSLKQKISYLEKSLTESPKSISIKRSMDKSPVSSSLKKICVDGEDDSTANGSLVLFEDVSENPSIESPRKPLQNLTGKIKNGACSSNSGHNSNDLKANCTDLDLDEEESLKIADEFGLDFVATTSMTTERNFSTDLNRKTKSFSTKKNSLVAKKETVQGSDLPHFRKGFNGMGGHTKTLVLPKKMGTLVKQNNSQKKAFKIPRNNTKITKFTSEPKLPSIELSP